MRALRLPSILAIGVLLLGAAGVPGSCNVQFPDGTTDAKVKEALKALEDGEFETLDFGGIETTGEAPYFGESPALYEEVDMGDVPGDPELLPEGPAEGHRGVLGGRFRVDREGATSFESGGVFRGRWANAARTVTGYLRGHFHPVPLGEGDSAKDGERVLVARGVFFGKYVDAEGHFMGILRGHYGKLEDGRGFFAGRWIGQHGDMRGALRGRWEDIEGENGGIFRGHWVQFPVGDLPAELVDYEFEEGDFGDLTTDDEEPFFGEDPDLYPPVDVAAPPGDIQLPEGARGCPHGWLAGWYRGDNDGPSTWDSGIFRGRWTTANGHVTGVLRGWYAPLEGQNGGVFYGKYISTGQDPAHPAGKFLGMIRGRYGTLPDGRGVFVGRWFDRNLVNRGPLRGRWHDIPEIGGGVFKGRWADICNPPE